MVILWDENNIAHLARHGVTPALAEKIIENGTITRSVVKCRYIIEATIDDKHYRLICDIALDGANIYPVTAFRIRKRKI